MAKGEKMSISSFLNILPHTEELPEFNPKNSTGWQGIKALWYQGAEYHGKPTKVFAYIGFPNMDKTKKVPAVVLVHGGGGHAFAHWIKIWNARGYAAIAMDTEGFLPAKEWKGMTGTEGESKEKYVRQLYDELADEKFTLGPENDGVLTPNLPQNEQWIYHGIIDTILVHNILRADQRIDKNKIGICGVSWGSVITSLAIGYDNRYAFAIPIYGSAYLEYATTNVCSGFHNLEEVRNLWSAADRLKNTQFPILWLCALYDGAFCSYSNSLSYLHTKKQGSNLSIQEELFHSHEAAWAREECYRFADSVVLGKQALITVEEEPKPSAHVSFKIIIPEDFEKVTARLVYSTEDFPNNVKSQFLDKCRSISAIINKDMVSIDIPEEAYYYYFEFTGEVKGQQLISTTSWIKKEENKVETV